MNRELVILVAFIVVRKYAKMHLKLFKYARKMEKNAFNKYLRKRDEKKAK